MTWDLTFAWVYAAAAGWYAWTGQSLPPIPTVLVLSCLAVECYINHRANRGQP